MEYPLDGCRAKIDRAEETIRALEVEIKSYIATNPERFKVRRELLNNGRKYAFIMSGTPGTPTRFSVLAGEIIHQLRSSLDHLVHALVLNNSAMPSRRHQFPICATEKKFRDACDGGCIKGISKSAEQKVKSVQPFTVAQPEDTVLHVIQQLDNRDKHQLLIVVSTVASIGNEIRMNPMAPGISVTGMSPPANHEITSRGAEIFSIDIDGPTEHFEAYAGFELQVAFQQCGLVKNAELVRTLKGLAAGARHTIELFSNEFSESS